MRKSIKIILITIISIILIVGAIAFSFSDTTVKINDTSFDSNIVQNLFLLEIGYQGYIIIETEVDLYNSGILDIVDLVVNIQADFKPSLMPSTMLKIGEGKNTLGTIPSDTTRTVKLVINATENMPTMAVSDGEVILKIDVSFSLQFIPYNIEIQKTSTENWDAPY